MMAQLTEIVIPLEGQQLVIERIFCKYYVLSDVESDHVCHVASQWTVCQSTSSGDSETDQVS